MLFNGTNAEDREDPTRVGLKAAADFEVRSPIDHLSKAQVCVCLRVSVGFLQNTLRERAAVVVVVVV